ncbi:transglycosylase family protein [Kitasatospora sp. NBC_01266]|uniref:transglycosylase family protein n=1 Tax=Kitasatospora sp. NBC_01266 TaxID=2903572 RepID=UPI002E335A86|nr:transglycosylase family protein [Kitasatospora sp. NBC_01266]
MGISGVFFGPGRHRRPTQTDRAVTAATVAGAGLALPLLTATGAHAAPAATWDAVAQCETGGNWSADTGDGYYGGLHFTQQSWVAYGGDQYGAVASHATEAQQIAVAERLLADQGPGVWGNCATVAGLTAPAATPTAPTTSAPTNPTGTTTTTPAPPASPVPPSSPTGTTPTGTAPTPTTPTGTTPAPVTGTPTAPGSTPTTAAPSQAPSTPAAPSTAPTAPTASPAPQAPTTPAAPAPTTTPTIGAAPTVGQSTTPPVATAPVPSAPTTPAAPGTPAPTPAGQGYTVQSGDNLWDIAQSHHLDNWQQLYQDNLGTVGTNPNLIYPGQQLQLP